MKGSLIIVDFFQAHEKTYFSYVAFPSSSRNERIARVENRYDIFRCEYDRGRSDFDICEDDMRFVGKNVVIYGAGILIAFSACSRCVP